MELIEVFKEAARINDFPHVKIDKPVRHSKETVGKIVEINDRGVAVFFPDMKWNTWFAWVPATDKRSHYANELSLLTQEDIIKIYKLEA